MANMSCERYHFMGLHHSISLDHILIALSANLCRVSLLIELAGLNALIDHSIWQWYSFDSYRITNAKNPKVNNIKSRLDKADRSRIWR